MNPLVVAFFLHNVFATLILGLKFLKQKDTEFKYFGAGLVLNSIAFAVWSAAVLMRPDNLELFITMGVVFFVASLITFFITGLPGVNSSKRWLAGVGGITAALILFVVRTFVYPSDPGFSPEGLFFFNPHPVVQVMYILTLAFVAFPALEVIARKFKTSLYSNMVRYCLIAIVVGGILLITSVDTLVLYIAGWLIGIPYFILWISLVFSKKAWY